MWSGGDVGFWIHRPSAANAITSHRVLDSNKIACCIIHSSYLHPTRIYRFSYHPYLTQNSNHRLTYRTYWRLLSRCPSRTLPESSSPGLLHTEASKSILQEGSRPPRCFLPCHSSSVSITPTRTPDLYERYVIEQYSGIGCAYRVGLERTLFYQGLPP